MKRFFEEYGIAALVGLTGMFIIGLLVVILNNSDLVGSIFVTDKTAQQSGLAVQEVANDEAIKSQKLHPTLKTHDLVLEFGDVFDFHNYIGETCVKDCFVASIQDKNGNLVDLSKYVTAKPLEGNTVDTTVSGLHEVDFILRWNNEFVRSKVKVYVKEDPNKPNVNDPDILNNYVRGILKDVDGNAVEAHLQLRATGEDGTALVFNANSGPSGSFIIYGVKPGYTYELYVVGYEDTPISTFLYEGGSYRLGLVGIH